MVNMVSYGELVAELESRFNTLMVSPNEKIPQSAPLSWRSLRLQQVKNTQQIEISHHNNEECHFDQLERLNHIFSSNRQLYYRMNKFHISQFIV